MLKLIRLINEAGEQQWQTEGQRRGWWRRSVSSDHKNFEQAIRTLLVNLLNATKDYFVKSVGYVESEKVQYYANVMIYCDIGCYDQEKTKQLKIRMR